MAARPRFFYVPRLLRGTSGYLTTTGLSSLSAINHDRRDPPALRHPRLNIGERVLIGRRGRLKGVGGQVIATLVVRRDLLDSYGHRQHNAQARARRGHLRRIAPATRDDDNRTGSRYG